MSPAVHLREPAPAPTPTQTPAPPSTSTTTTTTTTDKDAGGGGGGGDDSDGFKLPKLRLEIRDLDHPGARAFLSAVNPSDCTSQAVRRLLPLLYDSPSSRTATPPATRSVTLILRDMPGVAYTTGSDLDDDHKEIHFSLPYIARIPHDRRAAEVAGVVTHELVHCYQWNGRGSCPGGLVEGVADWVRLRCGLVPPHWKRDAEGKWDGGYQHTAYFLEYLESRFGHGTVRRLNEKLRIQRYQEKAFWTELVGRPVDQLWGDYAEKLKDEEAVLVERAEASGEEDMNTSRGNAS